MNTDFECCGGGGLRICLDNIFFPSLKLPFPFLTRGIVSPPSGTSDPCGKGRGQTPVQKPHLAIHTADRLGASGAEALQAALHGVPYLPAPICEALQRLPGPDGDEMCASERVGGFVGFRAFATCRPPARPPVHGDVGVMEGLPLALCHWIQGYWPGLGSTFVQRHWLGLELERACG